MQELITFITNHIALSSAIGIIFILVLVVEALRAKRKGFSVNAAQATQLINRENAVLIDVRSPEAFQNGHIVDSQAFTIEDIFSNSKKIEKFKKRPLIIVTPKGTEAQKITAFLLKQGYNAFSLTGGIRAWTEANLPVVKKS